MRLQRRRVRVLYDGGCFGPGCLFLAWLANCRRVATFRQTRLVKTVIEIQLRGHLFVTHLDQAGRVRGFHLRLCDDDADGLVVVVHVAILQ